jgi:single-strand DNA-binding protein
MARDTNRLPMARTTSEGSNVSGFNQAVILGRLVAPPEELTTKGGKLFIKAVVASSVHQKNSDGASEERTNFVPVTIFGRTAEVFRKYVQKGDMVHLVGSLTSNESTTGSGEKRLWLSFVVEQLTLLPNERAKTQQRPEPKPRPQQPERSWPAEQRRPQPTFNEHGEPDQIPF